MRHIVLALVLIVSGCQTPHVARISLRIEDSKTKISYGLSLDTIQSYGTIGASVEQ